MLYMIGLGLDNEKSITVEGLEAVKNCNYVYLETYTSKLNCTIEDLENFYGKKIIPADRNLVESNAEEILDKAEKENVAFLVIGDIFGATTHTDIKLRALKRNIKIKFIHNASILNVIGITGLELYKFGKITSIPFENKNILTPYTVLQENQKMGLHTLFLLDLRPDENNYMSIKQAIEYLLKVEKDQNKNIVNKDTKFIGCARLGSEKQILKYGSADELLNTDFKEPPHCLIIPGKMHFIEEEAVNFLKES